jgi:ribosome-binding factor A
MQKSGPSRKSRLESLLHREIATCVQRELRDPRIGFITITRVELSEDLHVVKAYYTILGEPVARRLAATALTQATGFVQRYYAPSVKTRSLPLLTFVYDDVEEKRSTMSELIRQARATDSDGGAKPTPASENSLPERPTPTVKRKE